MYKGFWGWSLENGGSGTVDTKYIIEYVDNAKTWERICYIDEHYLEIEPRQESCELYSTVEFDNVSEALTCYMIKYVSGKCYDIKMLEQIFVNGNMVLEQYIEPKSTTMYSMRTTINNEMQEQMCKVEMRSKELEKSIKIYEGFINKFNVKEVFEKFLKDYMEDK